MPYKHREDLYRAQKKYRIMIRGKLYEYLSEKKCIDCGESNPIVLDFDHKIPTEKFKSISKMLSGHYSWLSISKEIAKCEIRCANCHRLKSYSQFGFFGKSSPKQSS